MTNTISISIPSWSSVCAHCQHATESNTGQGIHGQNRDLTYPIFTRVFFQTNTRWDQSDHFVPLLTLSAICIGYLTSEISFWIILNAWGNRSQNSLASMMWKHAWEVGLLFRVCRRHHLNYEGSLQYNDYHVW